MADNGGDSAMLGVSGPAAAGILDRVSGGSVSELAPYSSTTTSLGGAEALVVRTDFLGGPGYDLVLPSSDRDTAWRELLDAGSGLGLKPAGSDALEALRIDRGRPAYGRELTQDFNPLEAGLEGYVSFNKECYIGQEVVARLNAYDKVQRRLVGLAWEGEYEPPPGAELRAGGRRVGVLTSVAASPRSPRPRRSRLRPPAARRAGGRAGDSRRRGGRRGADQGRPLSERRRRRASHEVRENPPSTTSTWPRIISASLVHRKATTLATSSEGDHPAQQRPTARLQHLVLDGEVVQGPRVHVAARDGVDRDSQGGELHGQVAGDGLQGRLGGAHREVEGQHPLGALAGDVDDVAAVGH